MDDSLVPFIAYEKMEQEAEKFLRRNYSEALRVLNRGQDPVWVNPTELAKKMELTIKSHRIKEDASVYSQIYFRRYRD